MAGRPAARMDPAGWLWPRRGRLFRLLWPVMSYLVTNLTAAVVWFYLFVLNRTTVIGRGNVGSGRNTMLVANHVSPLDGFLVGIAAFYPWTFLRPHLLPWNLAAAEHFYSNGRRAWLADAWRCIPVREGRRDARALRLLARLLPDGVVTFFPEGKRSRDGLVGPGRPGAGLLALLTRPRLVPVAIDGVDQVFPLGGFAFRVGKRIRVTFGKPIDCAEFWALPRTRETAARLVQRVMSVIRTELAELRGARARPDGGHGG